MTLSKNISPKKNLGQNFLNDQNISKKIVDSLEVKNDDELVEIGPGTGALTTHLFDEEIHYTGIEIDHRSAALLEDTFEEKGLDNFKLIQGDFKRIDLQSLVKNKIKLFGNLPYYITSPIIFKAFDNYQFIDSAVFMVQKEVAERIVAEAGNKDNGILAIASRLYSDPVKLFDVSPSCFFPKPKVWSSVVKFKFHNKYQDQADVLKIVKKAFNQRRKMISNTLKEDIKRKYPYGDNPESLTKYLKLRPEVLTVDQFVELNQLLK